MMEEVIKEYGEVNFSNERYQFLLEMAVDGLLLGDLNGNIISVNDRAVELSGYSKEELMGMHIRELFKPEELTEKPLQFDDLRKGMIVRNERRILAKNGRQVPIEMHSRMLPDNTYQTIIHDLSYSKNAEHMSKLTEQRMEALMHMYTIESESLETIINYALESVIKLTESNYGFIAFITEMERKVEFHCMQNIGTERFQEQIQVFDYNVFMGSVWGEVIEKRKSVLSNFALNNIDDFIHIFDNTSVIERYLSVPIFDSDSIVCVVGVANKTENYIDSDLQQLLILISGLWRIIKRKQIEADLLNNQRRLQSLFNLLRSEYQNEEDLIRYAIENAAMLTESSNAVFRFFNNDISALLNFWPAQEISEVNSVFSTIINKVVGLKLTQPLINNDYNQFLSAEERQLSVQRYLFVPLIEKGRLVVLAGVLNKQKAYDNTDVQQLQLYVQELWNIILRMRTDKSLREHEQLLLKQNKEIRTINDELNQNNKFILKINSELKEAKKKAEESDNLKSSFLANMSHEIRTPMNAIIGFSELLKTADIEPDTLSQYIDIINLNSHHLLSIIDDIVDISRIEAGQIVLNQCQINVNKIFSELEFLFKPQVNEKGLSLEVFKTLSDANALLKTDEVRLKQIMSNLISNAIKFTPTGGVKFGYAYKNNTYEFFVEDSGIGIKPEEHELAFERFRQLEGGMSRNYGGTGLGLTISRVLVELLGGKIWIDSFPGNGSTFYFTIPHEIFDNELIISTGQKVDRNLFNWGNKSILVAEDEEHNYFLICELLSSTNINITHAKNGLEAVEKFMANSNFDMVLMDIKMPEMDGYEATRHIKMHSPGIPVVAQTAYAMSEDRSKALRAGCDDYISKPLSKERLFQLINNHINRKYT